MNFITELSRLWKKPTALEIAVHDLEQAKNDAPYKVGPPVSRDLCEENMRNRMAFKSQPLVAMLDKSDVTNWSANDVKLLLDTVRITAPYTPDQLKKIQIFIGLLVEIKEPS